MLKNLGRRVSGLLADRDNGLSEPMRPLLRKQLAHLNKFDQQAAELNGEILTRHMHNDELRGFPVFGLSPFRRY